jgi:hypothetical protein
VYQVEEERVTYDQYPVARCDRVEALAHRVPAEETPRPRRAPWRSSWRVHFLDELPRSPLGEVQKTRLRSR